MANDFINTITTSNGTIYDVQDKRLTVTAADVGKVVSVDNEGKLTLVAGSSIGTQLYLHNVTLTASSGSTTDIKTYIKYIDMSPNECSFAKFLYDAPLSIDSVIIPDSTGSITYSGLFLGWVAEGNPGMLTALDFIRYDTTSSQLIKISVPIQDPSKTTIADTVTKINY